MLLPACLLYACVFNVTCDLLLQHSVVWISILAPHGMYGAYCIVWCAVLLARLIGQCCFACCRLSSVVVVCNAAGGPAGRRALGGRAPDRPAAGCVGGRAAYTARRASTVTSRYGDTLFKMQPLVLIYQALLSCSL